LNPDERFNSGEVRHAIETRVSYRTKNKLQKAASEHMTALENNPERIQAFFRAPLIVYAASLYLLAGSIE